MGKLLSLLLIVATAFSCAGEPTKRRNGAGDTPLAKQKQGQEKALGIYQKLDNSFFDGRPRVTGEQEYPDYYGGSYVDDDGGLVILATDTSNRTKANLQRRAKSADFRLQQCEYSFNELEALNKRLSAKFKGDGELRESLGWESVGLDIGNNRVGIWLNECTPQRIADFKRRVLNSPMLSFHELKPIKPDMMQAPKQTHIGR